MNLEKQIKRHVIGPRHTFFALTLPGYESICRKELARLSDTMEIVETIHGGITFHGRLTDLYAANLHLRTAGRILMRLGTFKATHFHQLVEKTKTLRWSLFLPAGAVPACKVTAHRSRLYHSQAIAQRVQQAITDHWMGANVRPGPAMGQTLYVRLTHDRVAISLDSSGDHLYRRGYKRHRAHAPLRETTAAIILKHAGYASHEPLMDPMCGAGTFSLEGAMMAKQMAPGLRRDFAFMQWPAFKPRQWRHMTQKAAKAIRTLNRPAIWASDMDSRACSALGQSINTHHLSDAVSVTPKNFFEVDPKSCSDHPGLVVMNPPYGRRLKTGHTDSQVKDYYLRLWDKLCNDFNGWRMALLLPRDSLDTQITKSLKHRKLVHGGLSLSLLTGTIS